MSRRACLRRVELATLRKILAVTLLEKKLRTKEVSLAPESLKGFLQRRCGEVIPLVIPPPGGKESKHGNPRTTTA
jgi:hypothetical protein